MTVWQHATARTHLVFAGLVGLVAGVQVARVFEWPAGLIVAWTAAAATFLVLTWPPIWSVDDGMTFQVSDTEIRQSAIRSTVLRQALVSSPTRRSSSR